MHIYLDADACPVVGIATKYNIPVTHLCDTNHVLTSDYSEVIVVEAGADAVDYKLTNLTNKSIAKKKQHIENIKTKCKFTKPIDK